MSTALTIIQDAYVLIGMNQIGGVPDAGQAQQGLSCLNQILDQWSLMPLTIPVTSREVFPLTAGRGGPSDTLTIGPGGDFDTARPTFISNVGLLVTNVVQPYELVRSIYTNDAYAAIVQKELTSNYFAGLYYNETFADGLGSINLYPVPANNTTSLVLYRPEQLRTFPKVSTNYAFPPGAISALTFELGRWLAMIAGKDWPAGMEQMRNQFLSVYQRANTVMTDLGTDPALTSQAGVYDILSGSLIGFGGR